MRGVYRQQSICILTGSLFCPVTLSPPKQRRIVFLKIFFSWTSMFSFGSSDVLRRCLSSEMKRRANIFSTRSDSEDVFVSRAATVLLLRKLLSTETEGAGKEMAARKLKPLKTREKKNSGQMLESFSSVWRERAKGGNKPRF